MNDTKLESLSNEPLDGELLSKRLARGRASADEALRLAVEIGVSLQKVHTNGHVHGQISPFCIVVTESGTRILPPTPSAEDSAPYRAPEQFRGEDPDVRSDIFAYGALIYEIASGKRAFSGKGAELAQRIATQAIDGIEGDSAIYRTLEKVIAGCVAKDPQFRRQRVQNAVIELKLACGQPRPPDPLNRKSAAGSEAENGGLPEISPDSAYRQARQESPARVEMPMAVAAVGAAPPIQLAYGITISRRLALITAAGLMLAATSLAAVLYLHQKPTATELKFSAAQPEHATYPGMPAVSPDGRYLTFSAIGPEGKRMLWVRPLDALHATVIPGSEGASSPFWSPDSEMIAFFGVKELQKVRISGGKPETICSVGVSPGGGAWNRDGTILFSPSLSEGFYRVSANGGKAQLVFRLDEAKLERGDLWPQFLPDQKHFVFYQQTDLAETSGVYAGSLDPPEYHRLFASQTNAVYSATDPNSSSSGHLLYINDRNLVARAFHAGRLEVNGAAITVATDIGAVRSLALAPISVSTTGVLVYQGVGQPTRQLVWMDRGGKQITVAGEPGEWGPAKIAPDGTRAVAGKVGADGKTARLWIVELSGAAEPISRRDRFPRRFAGLVPRWVQNRLLLQTGRCLRHLYPLRSAGKQAGITAEEQLAEISDGLVARWQVFALWRHGPRHSPGRMGPVGWR